MTTSATKPSEVNEDYWDYLHASYSEHRAYNECIQFEGDRCGECAEFDEAFDYAKRISVERAKYNSRYAEHVRRMSRYQKDGSPPVNEYILVTAHELTDSDMRWDNRVPEPITITDADRIECGKCAGTGKFSLKTARTAETGETTEATCFPCAGKGWMSRDDQWRTNTYWAKYARINP